MNKRESLMKQIDRLAAELGQEPGYVSNATIKQLEARLEELEALLPDEEDAAESAAAPVDEPAADGVPAELAEESTESAPESSEPAAPADDAEEVTAVPTEAIPAVPGVQQTCRVTAKCRFKGKVRGQTRWVAAKETVTLTAEEAADAIADGVAVKAG